MRGRVVLLPCKRTSSASSHGVSKQRSVWLGHRNACMEVCSFASFFFFFLFPRAPSRRSRTYYYCSSRIGCFCFDRVARGWMWGACGCGVSNSAGLSASACVQEQDACFNCLYPCKSQTLSEFLLVFYYTHGRACTHNYIHIYIHTPTIQNII